MAKKKTKHTRTSLVHPKRHTLQNHRARLVPRDRHGEELPVGFRVQVSAVEGQAVALADSEVPIALELVDMLGNETGIARILGWAGPDGFLAAVVELEGVWVEGCG